VAEFLDAEGIQLNEADKDGCTPLHLSASIFPEFPELAIKLIELGSNVNLVDIEGNSFVTLVRKSNPGSCAGAIDIVLANNFNTALLKDDELEYLPLRE
jgi:ankyrin repeat protein